MALKLIFLIRNKHITLNHKNHKIYYANDERKGLFPSVYMHTDQNKKRRLMG